MSSVRRRRLIDVGHERAGVVVVEVRGPLDPSDVGALCDQVLALLLADRAVICRLRGSADLGVVDALARMQLIAGRLDGWVRLQGTGDDLRELLELTGLQDVVPESL